MIETLFEILIITVLVLANGVLAAAEIGVVSSSKIRLHQWAREGDERARRALDLTESPNRFLSTVQVGITSVAVLAGAFGGARIAATLTPVLAGAGVPERFAHETALLLVVVAITYVTLVIGELVPKRIALHDPERLARAMAGPMLRLAALAAPLVRVLSYSTDLVLRLVPLTPRDEAGITEDEIRGMIAHATETGVLEATEQQIVERLFRLSDATVESIMAPRDVIAWLDSEADPESWRPLLLSGIRHTRFLVADGDIDSPVGYVMVRDLLQRVAAGEPPSLDGLVRQPHVLPAWTPVFRLLERFQTSGDHMAIITGDDGRVAGLATLNDVLAGIVGDMPPVRGVMAPGIVERDDGSWLVDGLIPFHEFLAFFDRTTPPGDYGTLHAFIKDRLEGAVARADVVNWGGLRLEVVDMDGSRVDQVLVREAVEEGAGRPDDIHWRW